MIISFASHGNLTCLSINRFLNKIITEMSFSLNVNLFNLIARLIRLYRYVLYDTLDMAKTDL